MDQTELIAMLNEDIADEHAAIIRYLVHSYLEGEDSPLGAGLLSRAREEMWHMHWLGMIIGRLGGEPNMVPAPYPFDATSRATIFASYVDYENQLVPHYNNQAKRVTDPHIQRVLYREGWESAMHAQKFQRVLDKLTPEQAAGLPGEECELPPDFVEILQKVVEAKYRRMVQTVRNAWVFQGEGITGWQLMDFSMTQMKQLAHVGEEVAENGIAPRFDPGEIDGSTTLTAALKHALNAARASRSADQDLSGHPEAVKHSGLVINLDLALRQEDYEISELDAWLTSGK